MKTLLLLGALAAPFALTACGTAVKNEPGQGASYMALGETDEGSVYVKDGKRHEVLAGTRVPREKLENSEFVKSVGRRGYKDAMTEKPGSPLNGGS